MPFFSLASFCLFSVGEFALLHCALSAPCSLLFYTSTRALDVELSGHYALAVGRAQREHKGPDIAGRGNSSVFRKKKKKKKRLRRRSFFFSLTSSSPNPLLILLPYSKPRNEKPNQKKLFPSLGQPHRQGGHRQPRARMRLLLPALRPRRRVQGTRPQEQQRQRHQV